MTQRTHGWISVLLGCALILSGVACSRPPATPEEEIRQLVQELEEAVGEKDISALKNHISERYLDGEQRNKEALRGILAYYFLQNRSIHLLTRVHAMQFPEPGTAEVVIFAAMAGTQIPDASWLPRIDADLYRFDATWAKEADGIWRLMQASWHPATTDDFG